MAHVNFEFKAATNRLQALEELLLEKQPVFKGTDNQTDTYFNVPQGRLKLREGNIENALIYYQRKDAAGAKQSDIWLYQHMPNASLKTLLTAALGIKVVVVKQRKIYFIDNVKFHFDTVQGLGSFVEVEAIDADGTIGVGGLKKQCRMYEDLFGIKDSEYIAASYSDLLLAH